MKDVIIIGGGLAGLINAIMLARQGLSITLYERKAYPFHRVCGEYISNEVRPFLEQNELFPSKFQPALISKFSLTSTNGRQAELDLNMGGFGISRYTFDKFLMEKALLAGVQIVQNITVTNVQFNLDHFEVALGYKIEKAKIVIGSYGKRSRLDNNLRRAFTSRKSPYLAVKRHIYTDFPADQIALHNFKGGYCGISKIENGAYNLCYLSHRQNLKQSGTIEKMEAQVLSENPFLKELFNNSDSLFDPIVINEISFEKKRSVESHIFMSGDSAGMIAPLCGNGMAMAIHSAKLLSETIIKQWNGGAFDRQGMEKGYAKQWNQQFAFRLWAGRKIQGLFGAKTTSNIGVNLARIKPIATRVVSLTHGKPF